MATMKLARALMASAAVLSACSAPPALSPDKGFGESPTLPAAKVQAIPVVNIAKPTGWPEGGVPTAPEGFIVTPLAAGLDHPRWIAVLPNGDVLVAETRAPPKPEGKGGLRAFAAKIIMGSAGAGGVSANRITLLRDANNDGKLEERTAFLTGLNSPFGMALIGETLYVANTDAVMAFPYKTGDTTITAPGRKLADLPGGAINHHWTKNIIASADGTKLYAASGSNSNVGENGMENEVNRAAILEIDITTGTTRLFASGIRNPVGLAWNPQSGALWTAVNERDEIGNDLVPDYMTSVKDGGFYGWPYSYYGQTVDARVKPPRPDMVVKAIKPDYALGAHTASLGLDFYTGTAFPAAYQNGAFIGQHGSWNRKPFNGYKVIYVPFANGKPAGPPQDFLTGFLTPTGEALGRPVGVVQDRSGALLVADDVGNVIWRVSASVSRPPIVAK